jgi:hypothetical protein
MNARRPHIKFEQRCSDKLVSNLVKAEYQCDRFDDPAYIKNDRA